jgi:hypothetical protein
VALVDAHGPPEGNAFAGGDDLDEAVEGGDGTAVSAAVCSGVNVATKVAKAS